MQIIGHRGAKGAGTVNTAAAMRHALDQGADGLEFDVRITRDGVPVVIHDKNLSLTRGVKGRIAKLTLQEINARCPQNPVPTLAEILDEFWGKTHLNIELKSRGSGVVVLSLLAASYAKHAQDWQHCILSSFRTVELIRVRNRNPRVQLALLQDFNPFLFLWYRRRLNLSAVGFHKQYLSAIAVQIARRQHLETYVYTVNTAGAVKNARSLKIDTFVTDYPKRLREYLTPKSS